MILVINDLTGGDLWCQLLDDAALPDIEDMPIEKEAFRQAMGEYLDNNGQGTKHVVRQFGLQSPVIKRLEQPMDGVKVVLYLY